MQQSKLRLYTGSNPTLGVSEGAIVKINVTHQSIVDQPFRKGIHQKKKYDRWSNLKKYTKFQKKAILSSKSAACAKAISCIEKQFSDYFSQITFLWLRSSDFKGFELMPNPSNFMILVTF